LSGFPSIRVYYITAEDFTNDMVHSLQNGSIDKFKIKYRNQCDVLLLEDVHHLTGKKRTQIELAFILDSLLEAGKKIFFTSCLRPGDIPKLNDKLQSHLLCSLISNIDPPDFKTRVRILHKKSEANGYCIPEEIIQYLAGELTDNVRQLEGGLYCVAAKSSLLGVPIDLSLAEGIVKDAVRQCKNITIDAIKKLVSKHFGISVEEIVSRSRKKSIVRPRQIAIYLSRMYMDSPLQTIGESFNRYHATALHSINAVEKEMRQKGALKEQVDFFQKKLDSGDF
jgi:chromosomal replication initiator protein